MRRPMPATLASAGPVAIDEHWDHLRHDSAYSTVLWISEWPRIEVAPHFLHSLVFAGGAQVDLHRRQAARHRRGAARDPQGEGRVPQRGATKRRASASSPTCPLSRNTATSSRESERSCPATRTCASPASSRHRAGLAGADAAVASVERAATQCGCETRILFGQQAAGLRRRRAAARTGRALMRRAKRDAAARRAGIRASDPDRGSRARWPRRCSRHGRRARRLATRAQAVARTCTSARDTARAGRERRAERTSAAAHYLPRGGEPGPTRCALRRLRTCSRIARPATSSAPRTRSSPRPGWAARDSSSARTPGAVRRSATTRGCSTARGAHQPELLLAGVVGKGKSTLAKAWPRARSHSGAGSTYPVIRRGSGPPSPRRSAGRPSSSAARCAPGSTHSTRVPARPVDRRCRVARGPARRRELLGRSPRPCSVATCRRSSDRTVRRARRRGPGQQRARSCRTWSGHVPPAGRGRRLDRRSSSSTTAARWRTRCAASCAVTWPACSTGRRRPGSIPRLPMVSLDLSRIQGSDHLIALVMTCASTWMEAALADPRRRPALGHLRRGVAAAPAGLAACRMQSQWKLSRALGIANLMVIHRLSDLDAVGEANSESRNLALGLLADCSTKIIYAQESGEAGRTAAALGLSSTEAKELPMLAHGEGLWRIKNGPSSCVTSARRGSWICSTPTLACWLIDRPSCCAHKIAAVQRRP